MEVLAFDRQPMTHADLNGYHGLPGRILLSAVGVKGTCLQLPVVAALLMPSAGNIH